MNTSEASEHEQMNTHLLLLSYLQTGMSANWIGLTPHEEAARKRREQQRDRTAKCRSRMSEEAKAKAVTKAIEGMRKTGSREEGGQRRRAETSLHSNAHVCLLPDLASFVVSCSFRESGVFVSL